MFMLCGLSGFSMDWGARGLGGLTCTLSQREKAPLTAETMEVSTSPPRDTIARRQFRKKR